MFRGLSFIIILTIGSYVEAATILKGRLYVDREMDELVLRVADGFKGLNLFRVTNPEFVMKECLYGEFEVVLESAESISIKKEIYCGDTPNPCSIAGSPNLDVQTRCHAPGLQFCVMKDKETEHIYIKGVSADYAPGFYVSSRFMGHSNAYFRESALEIEIQNFVPKGTWFGSTNEHLVERARLYKSLSRLEVWVEYKTYFWQELKMKLHKTLVCD